MVEEETHCEPPSGGSTSRSSVSLFSEKPRVARDLQRIKPEFLPWRDQWNEETRSFTYRSMEGEASEAKPSDDTKPSTPEFGDPRWFEMILLAMVALSSQAIWQNMCKVATQLNLTKDPAHPETFDKPLCMALTPYIGLAIYAPFALWHQPRIPNSLLQKIFISVFLGSFAVIALTYGIKYLPISSTIILRMGGVTLFTALGSFLVKMSPLTISILLSLAVIVAGIAIACMPSPWSTDAAAAAASPPSAPDADDTTSAAAAAAAVDSTGRTQGERTLGMFLVLLSTLLGASRGIVEEVIFANEKISAAHYASIYGLASAGIVVLSLIAAQHLPGGDHGVQEDSMDTLAKLREEPSVAAVLFVASATGSASQVLHQSLFKNYGATTTRVLASSQIIFTWVAAVALFAFFGKQGIGEEFILEEATLKLLGLGLIIAGQMFYLNSRNAADKKL